MGGITVQPNEITEVLNRPISQELLARDLTRLAYVAKDGTPRNVPIGFTWNGSEIVMCTAKNAPKLPALRDCRPTPPEPTAPANTVAASRTAPLCQPGPPHRRTDGHDLIGGRGD